MRREPLPVAPLGGRTPRHADSARASSAASIAVCESLTKQIARDGEGATTLVEVVVDGAASAVPQLAIGSVRSARTALDTASAALAVQAAKAAGAADATAHTGWGASCRGG